MNLDNPSDVVKLKKWILPTVIGGGLLIATSNSEFGEKVKKTAIDTINTDEGWTRMLLVYSAVLAVCFYIGYKYKYTRAALAMWFWG